jgi:hypothetical protein
MTGINREIERKILVEHLKKKKVCARFIPHLLTSDQKHQLAVTGDESWCFMYDPPKKKSQTATWLRSKKQKAQKVRMQKSRVKAMLTAFFLV